MVWESVGIMSDFEESVPYIYTLQEIWSVYLGMNFLSEDIRASQIIYSTHLGKTLLKLKAFQNLN